MKLIKENFKNILKDYNKMMERFLENGITTDYLGKLKSAHTKYYHITNKHKKFIKTKLFIKTTIFVGIRPNLEI